MMMMMMMHIRTSAFYRSPVWPYNLHDIRGPSSV